MSEMKPYSVRIKAAAYATVHAESKAAARREIEDLEKRGLLFPHTGRARWTAEVSSIQEVSGG